MMYDITVVALSPMPDAPRKAAAPFDRFLG